MSKAGEIANRDTRDGLIRAAKRLFAEKGLLEVVDEDSLSPEALARAIDRAAARPRPPAPEIDLDGARRTAELVARWTA